VLFCGTALLISGCSAGGSPAGGSARHIISASEFVTDSGKIECDNAEVQGHRTEHLPIRHSQPAEQSISCFVKGYTGPTARQPCEDLPEFTVHLNFGSYPTTVTCAGEEPKELSPRPYRSGNGGWVNLGGATCREVDPGVTCASNASRGISFTVSPASIRIPIAPGDTVRFAPGGLASDAQFRPPSLQISVDATFSVGDVEYTSWTQHRATGTGTLAQNSCNPDCAGGTYTQTRIKFVLIAPELACGHFFFTRISWSPAAGNGAMHTFAFGPPTFDNMAQQTPCDALLPPRSS
jgi:hypothetical protein